MTAPVRVTIIGPNLSSEMQLKGGVHVHASRCSDIARSYDDHQIMLDGDFSSVEEVVTEVYSDMIDALDPADWLNYVAEFYFAPCTRGLS